MANTAKEHRSLWDKVVDWYAGHAYTVQMVYSLGASVVIIGALFKILHWPGASYVLMAGMFTESFLFLIGIFEKPHATYHWENVFPQLIGEEQKPLDGIEGGNQQPTQQAPILNDEEMKALKDGVAGLAKTAAQLTQLGEVATASNTLVDNMNKASQATTQFAGAQAGLSQAATGLATALASTNQDMQKVAVDAKAMSQSIDQTKAQVIAFSQAYEQQMKGLNAAYELQLRSVQAQTKATESMALNAEKMQKAVEEGLAASTEFAKSAKTLQAQVADLNKVYGNMLNALA